MGIDVNCKCVQVLPVGKPEDGKHACAYHSTQSLLNPCYLVSTFRLVSRTFPLYIIRSEGDQNDCDNNDNDDDY